MSDAGTTDRVRVDYAACTVAELTEAADQLHALFRAVQAQFLAVVRALDVKEAFREDGCRDMTTWLVQRYGLAGTTARGYAETAAALAALPALERLLVEGRVSLDQLRPVAKVATPEHDGRSAAP